MAVERITIDWRMDENSRIEQRVAVLLKWSEEESGGIDFKQRYQYNVETFSDSGVIYLHRPAFLNKGCDFTVQCTPIIPRDDGKQKTNPRHQDLVREILLITNEIPALKEDIIVSINEVYGCKNVNRISAEVCAKFHDKDLSVRIERALKVLKWLFIEQDITDWNTSGRQMLLNEIQEKLGL